MSAANRYFCKIFAVVVLICFCIPSMANIVTSKSSLVDSSLSSSRGPHGQVSSNWVAYWKSDHLFKDKPEPKRKPEPKHHRDSERVAVADGDPSSFALLAVGLSGLLVTVVAARTGAKTRT
jgi:hypothetical protein